MTAQNPEDVSPQTMRAQVSPVSERYAAVDVGDETAVFDSSAPDSWILSDVAYSLIERR